MTLLRNDSVATELNERRADRNIKKKIQQQSRNININKQDGNADHLRPGSILEEKATSFRSVGARRGDRYINGIVKRRRKRRKKSTINQASIARVMTSRRAKKKFLITIQRRMFGIPLLLLILAMMMSFNQLSYLLIFLLLLLLLLLFDRRSEWSD